MPTEKTIRVLNRYFTLVLYPATVIQLNKHSRTGIFAGSKLFPLRRDVVFTDVVFRLKENGDEWPLYAKDVELPLSNGQQVELITINNIILGYAEPKTKKYYYTTINLRTELELGMPIFFVWIIGIIGGLVLYFVLKDSYPLSWLVAPLVIALVIYIILNSTIKYNIKKTLDRFFREEY